MQDSLFCEEEPYRELRFEGEVIEWRGPSPYFFVPLAPKAAAEVNRRARSISYGWGVAPVEVAIGPVSFKTSLFPKAGTYLLPLKDAVRKALSVTAGDKVVVHLRV